MTFLELVFDSNLAAADQWNVVPAGAVEDDSLTGFGLFSHLSVRFTNVLKRRAARAGKEVGSHFFAIVVFTDFVELVFEHHDGLVDFLWREVSS